MKTATIPSVRVEPEFRAEVESVLAEGESLSEFVEASVRAGVERRRVQAEFIARGLRSRDEARRTGDYVEADLERLFGFVLERELIIRFGRSGYVTLIEIESATEVVVVAVRHQLEDDYH